MYPPMAPYGGGANDRERNRGTYLPEDVWTEDLDAVPPLITGV
jgi:hypothetical protein